jgi:hypothetical protein
MSAVPTEQQLRVELQAVKDKIDTAYWAFTRTARGKPPCLVVPEAYARRTELRRLLAVTIRTRASSTLERK